MKNSTNITGKIGFIIILLTIVALNIYIGSNIKEPIWIIQAIISTFTLIYLIINKIYKKKNLIIKSKIDIVVLFFMVSTIIPILFNKYATFEGTCNFILKYWSVYGLYILVRNIVINEKRVNIVIQTVIISSLIPITFGIDKFTFNISEPFLDFINAVKIENDEGRMISTFGYANTLAAYLSLTIVLAIGQFLKVNNFKKALYIIYIIIAGITVILTQSKFVLALDALLIFIFIIKGIVDKKISKKWIISGIVAVIVFFIYFFIAIQIDKPVEITETDKTLVIRGFEPNTDYEFKLNINAESDKEYDTFEISIVEVTRYFSEEVLTRTSFSSFEGDKILRFKTGNNVEHIEIRISNKLSQKIVINNLYINNEKYMLDYKFIPEELVRIFITFNFQNPSVVQRVDFWNDSLEIIKDNWLIGAGGNAWRVLYGQVQDYLYYAKEAHNYILEVWMSFGLLGLISYILILAITIKNGIGILKSKNKDVISILVGISIIVLHSFMDFDMSFLIIEMIFFMFIAIINQKDKEIAKNTGIVDIIGIVMFLIITIGNILGLLATIFQNKSTMMNNDIASWVSKYQYNKIIYLENNDLKDEEKIELIKRYIEKEKYQDQNVMYEIMCNQIVEDINNNKVNVEDIKYIVDVWKNIKAERKYDVSIIQKRADIMLDLAENLLDKSENIELKNIAYEILEIIEKEYKDNVYAVLEYEKNSLGRTIAKYKYENYTNVYNKAINLLEKQE